MFLGDVADEHMVVSQNQGDPNKDPKLIFLITGTSLIGVP